jgi:hypothetical protein
MKDFLPIADKPEMPGFDHTGMDRAHAHLVQFFPFDGIKRISIHDLLPVVTVERISQRFQPGMIREFNSEILMDLPFKNMELVMHTGNGRQTDDLFLILFVRKDDDCFSLITTDAADELKFFRKRNNVIIQAMVEFIPKQFGDKQRKCGIV